MPSAADPLRLATGGLVALAVAMGIGRFAYTPILPYMAEALHFTKAQTGLIAAANFLGYFAGAAVTATSWIGGSPRAWLIFGMAASTATSAAMAACSSLAAFMLIRLLGGVASAFVLVFAASLVLQRLAQANRPDLVPVTFAGVGFGIALSSLLVWAVGSFAGGWQAMWIVNGLAAAIGTCLVAASVPPLAAAARRPAADPVTRRASAALKVLGLSYGLFGFGYVITATFLVAIVHALPQSRSFEPFVWLVVGLAAMPSVWLWTRAARRLGVFGAYALACIIEAVGISASVVWPDTFGIAAAGVCLGGTFVGITALGLNGARDLSPGDPRRVLAGLTAAFGIGQIIGPLFAGYVSEATGSFALPSLTAALLLLVAAGLAFWVGRHR